MINNLEYMRPSLHLANAFRSILTGLLMLLAHSVFADNTERSYSVFAYVGEHHSRHIHQILSGDVHKNGSYIWSVAATRKIYNITDDLILEVEANFAHHTCRQHHGEINAAADLRWRKFPWNDLVNTTFAYGLGPSYAFSRPKIENIDDREAAHLLVFMPVEITFGPPKEKDSQWESFVRIHHRSGAWGTVSRSKGSNFITAGIRYRF